jgi:hypothetical protein
MANVPTELQAQAVSVAEQIKREIREDLARDTRSQAGVRMTADAIGDFSDLHNFVDANFYGETHEAVVAAWESGAEQACTLKNAASDLVDAWIKANGHR